MPLSTEVTSPPVNAQVKRAHEITKQSIYSARSMVDIFSQLWKERGAKRGATTDKEQDVLRAMLVMACAGLDATLKQLIRDALPSLVSRHEPIRAELETFLSRKLRDGAQDSNSAKFMAKIFSANDFKAEIVSAYIYELTGDSLQSQEQLIRTAKALGVAQSGAAEVVQLKEVFKIRNRIVHELDINFEHHSRRRHPRKETDMVEMTDLVLSVMNKFVKQVDKALSADV